MLFDTERDFYTPMLAAISSEHAAIDGYAIGHLWRGGPATQPRSP